MQKLFRVNSKYRSSGTTSNFTMSFDARDLDTVQSVALLDATLNRKFPNIYSPNNKLVLVTRTAGPTDTSVTATIPEGQYTATELATALTGAILSAGVAGITVTYSAAPIDRFSFVWDGTGPGYFYVTVATDVTSTYATSQYSTISQSLGVMLDMQLTPNVPVLASTSPALEGPNEVYIQSNLIAGSNCVDVPALSSYIPYLGKISYNNIPYGFTGIYQSTQAELQQVNYKLKSGTQSIRTFDVQLTDRFGNILPIPANCFIDMHLAIYYNPGNELMY